MRLISHLLVRAVLAAVLLAAMAAAAPLALLGPSASEIVRQDAKQDCLSPRANAISSKNRLALHDLASTLNATPFMDMRMFAPAANATGKPDIARAILANDYPAAVKGLASLKNHLATFPDTKNRCAAPTARSLRTIYKKLATLVAQFSPSR
ncbi:hypothetical protein H4R19_002024 [Coemansia spiralis]|nr:hypothetical protein H4R19_002024 [Coemansia spiralis]